MAKLAVNGGRKVREKPFPDWPIFDDSDAQAVAEVVKSGKWGSIYGDRVETFAKAFAEFQQAKYGVCVANGTLALEVALKAVGVKPGDEVIIPAYTFVATASSVLSIGALPVFVDIDPNTYCLDPAQIEEAITERTSAIIPVHIGGAPADMGAINQVAQKHNLKVIEDAAQAHGAEWKGRRVGAIGHAGCFSFQSSKNLNAGEGGIVLTDDKEIEEKAWSLHNCGRIKEGAWYKHYLLGSNFRMTEFQAALLLSQLRRLPEQMNTRDSNATYLRERLSAIEGITPISLTPGTTRSAYHLFIFKYDEAAFEGLPRQRFIEALNAEGVPCSSGYVLLYREPLFHVTPRDHPFGERIDYSKVECPVCERACQKEAVWLYQKLLLASRRDMQDIGEAIWKIKENVHELVSAGAAP